MFRTQANPMDDAIVKATDENLTSENWEFILDVCDRVSGSPSGPQQAVASLIKRLAHRNANVQLYTLELANALSQSCGPALHRELASKAFTDALLRLAGDRNTHAQVKQKVLERMAVWAEEFRRTPELGIMEQAYQKLRVQQPGLMPPSKPVKREISTEDRRKEEEELQMALALSIKDRGTAAAAAAAAAGSSGAAASAANAPAGDGGDQQTSPLPQAAQQGTTAATVSRVRALYDFTPSEPGELAFRKNDIIAVLESVYKDWWKGSLRGQTGIFPLNYVEKLQDPTKEEMERDAQMESEVFGEIKNVEKLLALLSVGGEGGGRRGEREEEEISELYQRTLSIRPKLIELIARYSQKKDDFTQLNEKFIKARRDYEALLESSMSQPQYQQQYPIRTRPASQMIYGGANHQQPPYGGPQQGAPQGYPPQGPPSAQGYPPQPQFPPQGQQHLPPQQDPQRYYSPSPAEPPPQQAGFVSPYPPQNGPPGPAAANGPAPFHFIPGGIQAPPAAANEIRRKPSPPNAPNDPYSAGGGFQGQIRPNSIHTLNSGNPQELASGGYESPIDNRHSYPSSQIIAGTMPNAAYDQYAGQQAPAPSRNDRDQMPGRQRTQSFESPSSMYSTQPDAGYPPSHGAPMPPNLTMSPPLSQPQQPQQSQPQPQQPPPQQYQAYQPFQAPLPQHSHQQQQQQRVPSGGGAGADPGDFYR